MFDHRANAQEMKCLKMIDEFTKERFLINVGGSIQGKRLVEVLKLELPPRGYPQYHRSDNGPEFVGTVLLEQDSKHGKRIY